MQRLKRWMERPLSYKLDAIRRRIRPSTIIAGALTSAFRMARLINFQPVRIAAFDSIPKDRLFALASDREYQFLCLASDSVISRMISVNGVLDFERIQTAVQLLGPSFELITLVDIGANIGTICIPAVARGIAKKAIAIEPEPKNFRTLMANIYLSDVADRITCHNIALGEEDNRILQFDLSENNSGDHRVHSEQSLNYHFERDRKSISVLSSRLDTLVPSADRSSTLIWMDTQGYEGFILRGAQNIVESRIPLVVEFWPYGMTSAGSYHALKEGLLNYTTFFDLRAELPKPEPISEISIDNLFAKYEGANVFTDILVV